MILRNNLTTHQTVSPPPTLAEGNRLGGGDEEERRQIWKISCEKLGNSVENS